MLKKAIQTSLGRLGYEVRRIPPVEPENPIRVLDLLVLQYLKTRNDFFFVQVGANNGLRGDPLRHLVMKHRLAGLLVEPLPDLFSELKQNYADQPQLKFENVALAGNEEPLTLFRFSADAQVPDYAHGMARFDEAAMRSFAKAMGVPDKVEAVEVSGVTMSSLLTRHRIESFALLQVDTEGFDYEIVKMCFARGNFPEIINFEKINLKWSDRVDVKHLLQRHGYQHLDIGLDTVAVRSDFVAGL